MQINKNQFFEQEIKSYASKLALKLAIADKPENERKTIMQIVEMFGQYGIGVEKSLEIMTKLTEIFNANNIGYISPTDKDFTDEVIDSYYFDDEE